MTKVGDSISAGNANWSFGGEVANSFDDHVSKSVPLYNEGHTLITEISDYFLKNGSICYEIGCSTAELTKKLAERNVDKNIQFIGLDVEKAMLEKGAEKCNEMENIELILEDAMDYDFQQCDMIVSYYTIQFISPKVRQLLFDRIYNALNWGGAFVLFEKVRAPDARFQDISTGLYTDYKLRQGYSEEEIVAKTRSLKGVLEPFSTQGNLDMMTRSGFKDIMSVFKYVPFEGFLAIK